MGAVAPWRKNSLKNCSFEGYVKGAKYAVGFTTGQFASGEVAYALNNGNNIWKQTLDGEAKDSTPTLNTSKANV